MSVEQTPAGRASTRTAALFDGLAARYDAWYEGPAGRVLFPLEVACLWPLVEDAGRPRLEIGVGSGRFAQALEVEVGLDPAPAPLALARRRGVWPVQGVGELPPSGTGRLGPRSWSSRSASRTTLLPYWPRLGGFSGRAVCSSSAWCSPTVLGERGIGRRVRRATPFAQRPDFSPAATSTRCSGLPDSVVLRGRSTLLQSPTDTPTPSRSWKAKLRGPGSWRSRRDEPVGPARRPSRHARRRAWIIGRATR